MSEGEPSLRFLFDEHVNLPAVRALQARRVDALFVADVGLTEADDAILFEWARNEGRILVTRNYADLAVIVEEANRRELEFPGVLFLARSLRQDDVGAHLRTIETWLAAARSSARNPVANTYGWLR